MPRFIGAAAYAGFIAAGSALMVAGCGASSPPLSSGPIVVNTTFATNSALPTSPLAPGQSVTVVFYERRCRYQKSTDPAHQYRLLGCDDPTAPSGLLVGVAPMSATGQPCPVSIAYPNAGTVLFTKNGSGDPALGGPPNFWCSITTSDPTLTDPNAFSFRL